jgi:amino acid transporter
MKGKISLFTLVLLIVSGIDSIRTLPTTAYFGSSLIFFFLLSAILFLIPISFISAEFSSRYPTQGGVFHWVRHAFGNRMGALTVWLQWINTMVWYPTMLLFIAGTAAHLINPELASNKLFLLIATLVTFWGLTFLNLKGIQVSARINSFCGTIGTLFPMTFLIILGICWVVKGNPVALSFSLSELAPSFNLIEHSGALVTIMASFLGMELAGVHVGDIQNPQKNFPKAIGLAVLLLMGTLMFGSLSVATVIPKHDIQFVDGVMQTFTTFFTVFNLSYLVPVLALLIIIGSAGGSVNWLLSPAKGLLQAAEYGFLPKYFCVKNKNNVSVRILMAQAIVVSAFCLSIQLVPSINSFYWFLMALSTGLYMFMYILLFLSALKLGRPDKNPSSYQIPYGIRTLSCAAGLIGCLLTIAVGFKPSPDVIIESNLRYAGLIGIGFMVLISPVLLLWLYQHRKVKLK